MSEILVCDQCQSDAVDVFIHPDDIDKPYPIAMTRWAECGDVRAINSVYRFRRRVAQCRRCGFRVETRPGIPHLVTDSQFASEKFEEKK